MKNISFGKLTLITLFVLAVGFIIILLLTYSGSSKTDDASTTNYITKIDTIFNVSVIWMDSDQYVRMSQGVVIVGGVGHQTDSTFIIDTLKIKRTYIKLKGRDHYSLINERAVINVISNANK